MVEDECFACKEVFRMEDVVCEIADHWYKELGVMTDADDGRLKVKGERDSETGNTNTVGYMMEVAGELKRLLHTAKRRVGKCCPKPKKLKLLVLGMRSALLCSCP